MKIAEKLYVGFQRQRYMNNENPRILGFAVPNDNESRKNTVNRWREKEIDPRVIENTPQRYFMIVDTVSRYSTSNKLFRILDPRGFELEISAENLVHIIDNCTLNKSIILEDCIWAQGNGGKSYLLPTNTQEYKMYANKPEKLNIEKGGVYVSESNGLSVFRFEGIFHHAYVTWKAYSTKEKIEDKRKDHYSSYRQTEVIIQEYELAAKILMNSGKKPSYVYTEYRLDSHGNVDNGSGVVHIRKSPMKLTGKYEDKLSDEMKEPFNPLSFINSVRYHSQYQDKEYEYPKKYTTNTEGDFIGLFENKQDAIDFDYEPIINSILPAKNYISTQYSRDKNRGYYSESKFIVPGKPTTIRIDDKRK